MSLLPTETNQTRTYGTDNSISPISIEKRVDKDGQYVFVQSKEYENVSLLDLTENGTFGLKLLQTLKNDLLEEYVIKEKSESAVVIETPFHKGSLKELIPYLHRNKIRLSEDVLLHMIKSVIGVGAKLENLFMFYPDLSLSAFKIFPEFQNSEYNQIKLVCPLFSDEFINNADGYVKSTLSKLKEGLEGKDFIFDVVSRRRYLRFNHADSGVKTLQQLSDFAYKNGKVCLKQFLITILSLASLTDEEAFRITDDALELYIKFKLDSLPYSDKFKSFLYHLLIDIPEDQFPCFAELNKLINVSLTIPTKTAAEEQANKKLKLIGHSSILIRNFDLFKSLEHINQATFLLRLHSFHKLVDNKVFVLKNNEQVRPSDDIEARKEENKETEKEDKSINGLLDSLENSKDKGIEQVGQDKNIGSLINSLKNSSLSFSEKKALILKTGQLLNTKKKLDNTITNEQDRYQFKTENTILDLKDVVPSEEEKETNEHQNYSLTGLKESDQNVFKQDNDRKTHKQDFTKKSEFVRTGSCITFNDQNNNFYDDGVDKEHEKELPDTKPHVTIYLKSTIRQSEQSPLYTTNIENVSSFEPDISKTQQTTPSPIRKANKPVNKDQEPTSSLYFDMFKDLTHIGYNSYQNEIKKRLESTIYPTTIKGVYTNKSNSPLANPSHTANSYLNY